MTLPPPPAALHVSAPLATAFAAAYPTTERTANPPGAPDKVRLSLRPKALIPLGKDRFAVVAAEDDPLGPHAEPGAVSVAYVQRDHRRWRLVRRWDEAAWTGNSGRAADTVRSGPAIRGAPVAVVSASYVGQGEETTTAWLLALEKGGPRLLGSLPMGGSFLDGEACDDCRLYRYRGAFARPEKAGDVLSVSYRGWTAPAKGRPKATFDRRADYGLQGGALVIRTKVRLPGQS